MGLILLCGSFLRPLGFSLLLGDSWIHPLSDLFFFMNFVTTHFAELNCIRLHLSSFIFLLIISIIICFFKISPWVLIYKIVYRVTILSRRRLLLQSGLIDLRLPLMQRQLPVNTFLIHYLFFLNYLVWSFMWLEHIFRRD